MSYRERFVVRPGEELRLSRRDPSEKAHYKNAAAAANDMAEFARRLGNLQSLLYAEQRRSFLIVLQAPDAGGKDGTIRHVFSAFNPQGVRVVAFKEPTRQELAHDFLWRVHPQAPGRGEVVIFNRSHYEDVLVPRVHGSIDRDTWVSRYQRIRDFEAALVDAGTVILKFFLHISKGEQLQRFADRLNDPNRNWKISASDYTERELWDDYVVAFEEAIPATSTAGAPWFVIPANHKWYRNLAVSGIVAETLDALGMSFPAPTVDLRDIRRKYHAEAAKARG